MVHPDVPGILLTPICTQSLSFRPIIFPDRYVFCTQILESRVLSLSPFSFQVNSFGVHRDAFHSCTWKCVT